MNDEESHSNILFDSLKMNMFMNFRTGNYMIDTFITTALLGILSFIFQIVTNPRRNLFYFFPLQETIDYWTSTNRITIEGRSCLKTNQWATRSENLFSNRFRAIWYYINSNLNNNNITSIKEYAQNVNSFDSYGEDYEQDIVKKVNCSFKKNDMFVVSQRKNFKLSDKISCKVTFNDENIESGNKTVSKVEVITIHIYSNKLSLVELQNFIDDITNKYLENIYNCRWNKLFIYSLEGANENNERRSLRSIWNECNFNSTRTFENLFFDDKDKLIEKINFFKNNKNWYETEGHPYTLGIGLHGPPGTGKTSVIKCIANMLKRHLIVIPLDKVKTQNEFTQYFFESKYNHNNSENSIMFDKKIIVLDDIDCMSDIIHDREKKKLGSPIQDFKADDISNKDLMKALVKGMQQNDDGDRGPFKMIDTNKGDDKITLSFLLNVIDGIRETPGRILIITSNYYSKIDKALKRPGRIDYTLEMKNASNKTICEMYKHYYKKEIPKNFIRTVLQENKLSPAKIVNIRLQSNNSDDFLKNLKKEFI